MVSAIQSDRACLCAQLVGRMERASIGSEGLGPHTLTELVASTPLNGEALAGTGAERVKDSQKCGVIGIVLRNLEDWQPVHRVLVDGF